MTDIGGINHVVPEVHGGVWDFAQACVARQPGSNLVPLSEKSSGNIRLSGNVILHFSGYGYQRKGLPFWLLEKFTRERSEVTRLGIFFHEIFAFGPPWRTSFWTSWQQRSIAKKLVQLSDFWITNRVDSAKWLKDLDPIKPQNVLPVFSNVGESATPLVAKQRRAVVFGGKELRLKCYEVIGDRLYEWAKRSDIEVFDIGPSFEASNPRMMRSLNSNGVRVFGALPAEDVSAILDESMYGLLSYAPHELEKSGVFAAYCAHAVCPIVLHPNSSMDKVQAISKFWLSSLPADAGAHCKYVKNSIRGWNWYQTHSIDRHLGIQEALMYG